MKSLEQQISDKCIHFNGIMSKECKAGINYDDVKTGKPFEIPCLKTGGECSKSQFPTEEEVKKRVTEINGSMINVLNARSAIQQHVEKTNEWGGKIPCECGGELHYRKAKINGHIWAKCSSCDISFME